jgi:tRNA G18 (ribose-2'-O)-methylase SpoU
MPRVRVDGADDVRIAEYRTVREAELLRVRGLFVAEGRLVVERLIADGRYVFRSLLVNEAACRALEHVLAGIDASVPIYVCSPDSCSVITGFNVHRGCLALVERPRPLGLEAILASARRLVVLEGVADPDNVGGVFRNAAAFGADGVLLSPTTCDPLYRKAVRTSMAASLQVPFTRVEPWPDVLSEIGSHMTLIGLTPKEPAMTIDEFAASGVPDRLALLVGSEGSGVSDAAGAYVHHRVRILISPRVDSLNLSVATGIALSRLRHSTAFDDTSAKKVLR